jgi:hypothetical protein
MAYNEFDHLTIDQLQEMLADVEEEAHNLEHECRERHHENFEMGIAWAENDPACDYVADDLWRRADQIKEEIFSRRPDHTHFWDEAGYFQEFLGHSHAHTAGEEETGWSYGHKHLKVGDSLGEPIWKEDEDGS